jgi:hypothetical protein
MSIYATLWSLRFPRHGDDYPGCAWITVTAQGVPAHIGSPSADSGYADGDPYGAFLPPPVPTNSDGEAEYLRAVVFITENARKGTARSPQEYPHPLLVLSGETYAKTTFDALHSRICDALRGDNPRVVAVAMTPSGALRIVYEDGTVKETMYQDPEAPSRDAPGSNGADEEYGT